MKINPETITLKAIDGTVKMSKTVYETLDKAVMNLTSKSVLEILQLITELTQTL